MYSLEELTAKYWPDIGTEKATVEVTALPGAEKTGNILSGVTDFVTGLAGLFNNGIAIYSSVSGQIAAAKQIANESNSTATTVIPTPTAAIFSKDSLIKMGLVVGVGVGLLLLLRKR